MTILADTPAAVPDVTMPHVGRALSWLEMTKGWARRHQREELGKDVDPGFCFGDFLLHVKQACKGNAQAQRYLARVYRSERGYIEKTALDLASGVIGGYVVPPAFSSALMVGVAEKSIFRRYGAKVIECDSNSNLLPVFDYGKTGLSIGQPPYWGGLWPQAYQASTTGRPESEPQFRQIELNPWVITFNCFESNTMRQDHGVAPATQDMLIQGFVEATAWAEDYLFFQGNGVAQPLGIVNAPGTLLVTRAGGAGSQTIAAADTQTMLSKMLPLGSDDAVWLCQSSALAKLSGITGWVPNTAGPLYLHGRPVVPNSGKASTLGNTGDLLYFSPALYAIGVRKDADLLLDFSDQASQATWQANQSVWRMVHRVDGQPRLATTVKLEDNSTVVAGYVALQ